MTMKVVTIGDVQQAPTPVMVARQMHKLILGLSMAEREVAMGLFHELYCGRCGAAAGDCHCYSDE
jgi:hypothetical protein